MDLSLIPITGANRTQAQKLRVALHQCTQIETVAECLAEADRCANWRPMAICDGSSMIGFSMVGYFPEEENGRLWFDRFLIDADHQHRGYGRHALSLLLDLLWREYEADAIYLSVIDPAIPAVALYQQEGFFFNGERDPNGEHIMVCLRK